MNVTANLVEGNDDLQKAGDVQAITVEKYIDNKSTGKLDYYTFIMCCPKCGKNSASSGGHRFNKETVTVTPSIVHNEDLGGCGYHGWLQNGIFTEV